MVWLIILILCVGIAGCLYWDKAQEVKRLETSLLIERADKLLKYGGSAIFAYRDKEEMAADVDTIVQDLGQRDIKLSRRKQHKWGYELYFDNDYTIFLCDPRIEIPKLPVSMLLIGEELNADQTIQILLKHEGQITEVHLYTKEDLEAE